MGFEMTFDTTQVNVLSLTVNGTNWFIPDVVNTGYDNSTGELSMAGGRIGSGLTDTILLGSIEFECMAIGSSILQTLELLPGLDTYNAIVAVDGYVYDKEVLYGCATVNQVVPIPAAVWLLGSGLVGLIGLRRKVRS